jgi:hypothetical protein
MCLQSGGAVKRIAFLFHLTRERLSHCSGQDEIALVNLTRELRK